ncbi:hypothetical protein L202_03580 [Cryptococcus amylolentus CBS 6039]|uniref:Uncharacterized protein n=1 Tax=Cryptococcus amylolentus CBS 6039 TaxID=1295533 RepID=A0A1E3HTF5_9TREE|nr:hypothetical protein L202_03580 [Cryptococcus amylolentus CBS 6039]ODN79639.1 hypothetical protein L202_03580 [Cryptococcus amylolentus CBS 6039]
MNDDDPATMSTLVHSIWEHFAASISPLHSTLPNTKLQTRDQVQADIRDSSILSDAPQSSWSLLELAQRPRITREQTSHRFATARRSYRAATRPGRLAKEKRGRSECRVKKER